MKIIGITGKSGSGKSIISAMIAEKLKCSCIDIDKIGHEALKDDFVKSELTREFGTVILIDGEIERKKLGKIIFGNEVKMKKLEDITWEYMQDKIDSYISDNKSKYEYIILDWALLPKSKYFDLAYLNILVTSEFQKREKRISKRDNITSSYIKQREESSLDYTNYSLRFNLEICNEGEIKDLQDLVNDIQL